MRSDSAIAESISSSVPVNRVTPGQKLQRPGHSHFTSTSTLWPASAAARLAPTSAFPWSLSKLIGNCLRAYQKEQYTYGTSQGKTFTITQNSTRGTSTGENQASTKGSSEGTSNTHGKSNSKSTSLSHTAGRSRSSSTRGTTDTSGTNESQTTNESTNESETTGISSQTNESSSAGQSEAETNATNNSVAQSTELRGEAAIEPHEFSQFPDLPSTGIVEGVFVAPTVPIWRVQLQAASLNPNYEFPEKVHDASSKRSDEEDERVSRSVAWSEQDLKRLCLDAPLSLPSRPKTTLLGKDGHYLQPKTVRLQTEHPEATPPVAMMSLSEEATSDESPLADFDF